MRPREKTKASITSLTEISGGEPSWGIKEGDSLAMTKRGKAELHREKNKGGNRHQARTSRVDTL